MSRRRKGTAPTVVGHGDLTLSFLLIAPLYLAYEIGVMFSATINGVDFVTRWTFAAVGSSRVNFIALHLALAAAYVVWVVRARGRRRLDADVVLPVVFESGIYALTLGTMIVFLMQRVLGLYMGIDDPLVLGDVGEALVISLGAGVHEELVFRLLLMSATIALALWAGLGPRSSLVVGLVASALVFSLAHHVGAYGDPLELRLFTFRALAGVAFGLIFYYRSLAHAVYSHFLYDLYVLVVQ